MPIFKTKKAEMENDIFPLFSIIKGEREEKIGKNYWSCILEIIPYYGNKSIKNGYASLITFGELERAISSYQFVAG